MRYRNFSDAHVDAPSGLAAPVLTISRPLEVPYDFTYPPTQVPWGGLDPGEQQDVASAIHATNSAGKDAPGLDPGAQQCVQSALFEIVLLNVNTWDVAVVGPIDGIQIQETPDKPFGVCTVNTNCPPT
jgi:hypothetical protein